MTARDAVELLVIGAGINGAAIARDAALRGVSVTLVDKGDIGGGTTAWSSRLIHGGLRYLEHGEVGLVRESLRERELLLRNARGLVRPLPFLLPLFEGARRPPWLIRAGLSAYDLLAGRSSLPRHRMLSAAAARRLEPGLSHAGLRGAALYWDAQADYPERLAVENALDARAHGAELLTHTRVEALTRDGARLMDAAGAERVIKARVIVNATGPWLDRLTGVNAGRQLIGGTQGSHIVVAPFAGAPSRAIYAEAARDGRPFFVIPWLGRYLIGATDTRVTGDPDAVTATDGDIAYLLAETNQLFPDAALSPAEVLYSYAGVRPLPFQPRGAEGAITRRHVIHEWRDGDTVIFAIVGGKLTTHRSLAEQVVDRVCLRLGIRRDCPTRDAPLPGASGQADLAAPTGLDANVVRRLTCVYGARARAVLALSAGDPAMLAPLCTGSPVLGAEIAHAFLHEAAVTIEDALMRRAMLGLEPDHGLPELPAVIAIARCRRGWDAERAAREAAVYRRYLLRLRPSAAAYNLGHE